MSQTIIDKIRAGGFSSRELENLCANAERLGRDEILKEAKGSLKERDIKSYLKRFIKPIRDKVKRITEELANENNWAAWENNKVGNGIRPSGAMSNGHELAEFYFSYRHEGWKKASYMAVFQHDEDSAVMYKIWPHNGDQSIVETSENAVSLFNEAIKTT